MDAVALGVASIDGKTLSGEFMNAILFTGDSSDRDPSRLLSEHGECSLPEPVMSTFWGVLITMRGYGLRETPEVLPALELMSLFRGLMDEGDLVWGAVLSVKMGTIEEKDDDFSLPGLVRPLPLITTFPERAGMELPLLPPPQLPLLLLRTLENVLELGIEFGLILGLLFALLLLVVLLFDRIIGNGAGCLGLLQRMVFTGRLSSFGLMDSNGSFITLSLARRSLTRTPGVLPGANELASLPRWACPCPLPACLCSCPVLGRL